jgi:hypothetical protein
MKKIIVGFIVIICFSLISCNPDSIEMEIYSSDIKDALTKVILIPATIAFNTYSNSDDESTQSTIEIAKKYLGDDTQIMNVKADFGSNLVIKCKIPMSTREKIDSYVQEKMNPFALIIDGSKITFDKTIGFEIMNKEISNNNMMMSIDMPSKKTIFRIVGDNSNAPNISAVAVFVDDKAELQYSGKLDKRSSIKMLFNGDSSSVYSQIAPQFNITFND